MIINEVKSEDNTIARSTDYTVICGATDHIMAQSL